MRVRQVIAGAGLSVFALGAGGAVANTSQEIMDARHEITGAEINNALDACLGDDGLSSEPDSGNSVAFQAASFETSINVGFTACKELEDLEAEEFERDQSDRIAALGIGVVVGASILAGGMVTEKALYENKRLRQSGLKLLEVTTELAPDTQESGQSVASVRLDFLKAIHSVPEPTKKNKTSDPTES